MALALSHTRWGLPSTQMVRFWRLGLTVRLCTPTCLRPTPPLRFAEPLRVLVLCLLVLLPVTAQTRGMSFLHVAQFSWVGRVVLGVRGGLGAPAERLSLAHRPAPV